MKGFVSELKGRSDTTTYYDFMGHPAPQCHCEKCGRIADMDLCLDVQQGSLSEQTGYQITKSQMVVYGICQSTQQSEKRRST